jgi:hypothetical protein
MKKSTRYKVQSEKLGVLIAFFLSLITYHLSLITIYAASCDPLTETETELGCIKQNPIDFTKQIYGAGLGLIGGVGLLSIIYGGYLILSSQGDPGQLQKGKSYIMYAIIGIVLAIAGFAIYQIISIDVLKLPGFSR